MAGGNNSNSKTEAGLLAINDASVIGQSLNLSRHRSAGMPLCVCQSVRRSVGLSLSVWCGVCVSVARSVGMWVGSVRFGSSWVGWPSLFLNCSALFCSCFRIGPIHVPVLCCGARFCSVGLVWLWSGLPWAGSGLISSGSGSGSGSSSGSGSGRSVCRSAYQSACVGGCAIPANY